MVRNVWTDRLKCTQATGLSGNKTWTFKGKPDPLGLEAINFTIERQPNNKKWPFQATGTFKLNGHLYEETFNVKWIGEKEGLHAHGEGKNDLGPFSVALYRVKYSDWFIQKTYVRLTSLKPKPVNPKMFWEGVKKRNQAEALKLAEEIKKGRKRKCTEHGVSKLMYDRFGAHTLRTTKRPRSLSVSDVSAAATVTVPTVTFQYFR
jgi:hypothetical protein